MGHVQVRLAHPALDFWIDVRVRDFDGRWLAVADVADTPEVGTGKTRHAALTEARRIGQAPLGNYCQIQRLKRSVCADRYD